MRAVILGLTVFALGLATAALVSPRAGAHVVDGSLSGSVGPGFTISMSASSVTAGNYTINVTDSSSMHNFHFSGPGVDKSTSINGMGSTSWSVTLQAGTYSFQCDAHPDSMNGSLSVTDGSTTTTDTTSTTGTTTTTTTPTTTTTTTTTTTPTTTAHTTTAHTTTAQTTTAQTTTAQTTTSQATTTEPTTTAATTTAPATTQSTPTTTRHTTTTSAKQLKARVTAAKATAKTVSISVTSTLRGRALAQLFSGTQRVAEARGTVPGKLVLRPARPLKPGRYTLRLRVTSGRKTTTATRTVTVP
jgi:hypothetical protein